VGKFLEEKKKKMMSTGEEGKAGCEKKHSWGKTEGGTYIKGRSASGRKRKKKN